MFVDEISGEKAAFTYKLILQLSHEEITTTHCLNCGKVSV